MDFEAVYTVCSPVETNWSSTEWYPLQINAYPDKVAYIEKLKKEGAVFYGEIRKSFEK